MKFVFIDTNVLIDILANRQPFVKDAVQLYSLALNERVKLYTSSKTITTIHYVLKKYSTEDKIRLAIKELLQTVEIIPVSYSILSKSLGSQNKDFEDAIQISAAQSITEMDCIVTRDLKDYKYAEIEIYTPDQFLHKYSTL